MKALDVVKIEQVKTIFGVFVAALKFMLKICLEKFDDFVLHFTRHAVLKSNPYLRRFNTECLSFLIKKIRNEQILKKRVGYLFSINCQDLLEINDTAPESESMAQENSHFDLETLKADFMACLLFEILKGTNGYLSD